MSMTLVIAIAALWLISPMILLVMLLMAQRQVRELRESASGRGTVDPSGPPSDPIRFDSGINEIGTGYTRYAPHDLDNLLLLRLELQRLGEAGILAPERQKRLLGELDQQWARHLSEGGATPENLAWQQRRSQAWSLLAHSANRPPGLPPWLSSAPEPVASSDGEPAQPAAPLPAAPSTAIPPYAIPLSPDRVPSEAKAPVAPTQPPRYPADTGGKTVDEALEPLEPLPAPAFQTLHPVPSPRSATHSVNAGDWQPRPPNPLEKVLDAISGWPTLIAPFLAQNIGWFIGGFCFIAGALFLIANTSGFINGLVVFASLLSASAFLLWAAYQFRQRRPELLLASTMLLTLSVLLAPLVLAVAVRLVVTSQGELLLLIISLLITAATLAALAWAIALSSALVDRTLQGRYAQLLTALAAIQLAAPIAGFAPSWHGLAVLHALLLGLLGYGLWTFSTEWLRHLLIDRRMSAYYAVGILVYTAVVSFVHLTWLWPEPLPAGYAGPFLMALCGLLFPLDAALKEWVQKYAFLSRFSFALYALSAVAVAVALQATPATLLTLAMGAALYGWITARYRTLPPLYLLFGCLAGLYGFGVLHLLPPIWHGIAGLPGLLALLGCSRWASSRSRAIALQCLLVFVVLLVGLTAWNLSWTVGHWLGLIMPSLAAVLGYVAVRQALQLPEANPRWAVADSGVVILATAAIASMPTALGLDWAMQTAFGLLGLALLWTLLGLPQRQASTISRAIFVNSALLSVGTALVLGGLARWPELLGQLDLILLLLAAGGLLFWLSFDLQRQNVFYGVLGCATGAVLLIKHRYFPGLSSGLSEFLLVLATWFLLWWLGWHLRFRQTLLGDTQVPPRSLAGFGLLIRTPLEQAMILLWVIGLGHLLLRVLDGNVSAWWPVAVGLGILTGLLLIGHFHRFRWVALPFFLGLAGVAVEMLRLDLSAPWIVAVAVLYALLVWRLAIVLLAQPSTGRWIRLLGFSTPDGSGGQQQVEESLHASAQAVAVAPIAFSIVLMLLGDYAPEWLPAVMVSLAFWLLAGGHYRTTSSVYAALLTALVGAWLASAAWVSSPTLPILGQPVLNGFVSLLLATSLIALEQRRWAPLSHWRTPLQVTAALLYGLALAGTLLEFLAGAAYLPGLLVLLCIALFPLARPWPNAAAWRGLGLPLLLGVLFWHLASPWAIPFRDAGGVAIIGGYSLWLVGNLLLPRWNNYWPGWAVAAELWPLLGLIAVLSGVTVGVTTGAFSLTTALAVLTPYLFLLLHNTAWSGMGWIAVATLTLCALSASGWLTGWGANQAADLPGQLNRFGLTLLALNLLLLLLPLWRRYGQRVSGTLGWRSAALEPPLFWLPFAALLLVLNAVVWLEIDLLWRVPALTAPLPWMLSGVALLLVVTAGHAVLLRLKTVPLQVALLALQTLLLALFLNLTIALGWLPLLIALWNAVLLLAWRYGERWPPIGREALEFWLVLLPMSSLALLWTIPPIDWRAVTATLLLLAAVTLTQGWWQRSPARLQIGLALALAGSYTVWLTGVSSPESATLDVMALRNLAPWYALQSIVLLLASQLALPRLARWVQQTALQDEEAQTQQAYDGVDTLRALTTWLLPLGLLWLGIHAGSVFLHTLGWGSIPWHFGPAADALAMGATLSLLALQSGIKVWRQPSEPNAIYATALWLGLLAAYTRLVLWGLAPFNGTDTTALLIAAYVVFFLHQFTGSRPLYHLALLLPLLALATVPWQLASSWTGGTLLAAAVLYLSLAGTLRNPLPLYLGVLALNGAIYLWAPLWAERYGLWQFYIVPAAVSVLVLLQLHRRELRPNVLSGARLAALSALYAGAGLDVFLRPELGVFIIALVLALTGVVLGIALRIRAFLYAGMAFLVLNVVAQLLRFYPEQAMSRALILLGLGIVITVGMVFFNLKREAILQRIRLARADLAAWD